MTVQMIEVKLCETKKKKPESSQLEFGRVFTDHMFIAEYTDGQGWSNHRIVPYEPITLDPAAIVFHYGQTVFEGLKAYLSKEGAVRLFSSRTKHAKNEPVECATLYAANR